MPFGCSYGPYALHYNECWRGFGIRDVHMDLTRAT